MRKHRSTSAHAKRGSSESRARRASSHVPPDRDSASQYSRRAGSRYTEPRSRKRRRFRIVRNVFLVLALLVAVGAGTAWAYVNMLNHNLSQGVSSDIDSVLVAKDTASEPFYVLLLGTDQAIWRDEDESYGGIYRTDSMMLARIDPTSKKATLVSIPRDTKIQNMGGHGVQKINAAYAFGGATMAVSTVSELAGVSISHFALIDMDGLSDIVDALGGIEVDVPYEIDDEDYTGHLDAGLQTLDGEQALILARTRHAFDKVGDGDEYRAADQRLVLSAIAKKVLSSDAATIAKTVEALSKSVQTDMSVEEIVGIAQALQGMDTENDLYSATMPNEPVYENNVWYTNCLTDKWAAMMKRVDAGLPPTEETVVDKSTGIMLSNAGSGTSSSEGSTSASEKAPSATSSSATVSKGGTIYVRNGGAPNGTAAAVSSNLTAEGYTVADTGNADSSNYKSNIVVYEGSSNAAEAKAIAAVVGHGAVAMENDGTYSLRGDFLVVLGSSY